MKTENKEQSAKRHSNNNMEHNDFIIQHSNLQVTTPEIVAN